MINPPGRKVDAVACRKATDMLRHRGPDAYGEWISGSGDVFLGHRRLSIIDLSDRSQQPMVGVSGAILTYNGEIYNFRELRDELKSLGCRFSSAGDTEVLLQALETWGVRCLTRLEGMFAFFIWDPKEDRGIAVRDFFGIKPLYLFQTGHGGLMVSSEVKSFYALTEFEPEIDRHALPELLRFRSVCGGRTLLRGVRQLKPGHILRFDRSVGTAVEECYWNPVTAASRSALPHFRNEEQFLSVFRDTVQRHLIADVPVGAQFSGGVDSSLISAVAKHELRVTLKGFHCQVSDASVDESPYALDMARELSMSVRVALLDDETFLSDLLERVTWFHDEPLTHPNSLGIYLVAKLAHGSVTILLSGEAADEFFGGYGRYPLLLAHRLLRRPVGLLPESVLLSRVLIQGTGQLATAARYMQRNRLRTADEQIVAGPDYMDPGDLGNILGDSDAANTSIEHRSTLLPPERNMDVVARCQLFDVQTYLPPLLMRQDKMSMAASIENRVPFVTPAIFTSAMALPLHYRASLTGRKRFLKSLLSRYVPRKMASRQKQGFGIPLNAWLKRPAGMERLNDLIAPASRLRHVVDITRVQPLVTGFNGDRRQADVLWTLMGLKLWMDVFCGSGKQPVLTSDAAKRCGHAVQ
jgi:asparagine synthase (glutamine-hydrolysing)